MSSEVIIPMLSFTDTILDGEQFGSAKLADDYLDLLPPDMFRAEFLGRNVGPVEFFLPELRAPHVQAGTVNLAPYLLLHDVNPWPIWSEGATWTKLFAALDDFGIVDAEFVPYWSGAPVAAPEGVLVSVYRREGSAVLAVMNTGEATQAQLDVAALKAVGSASDLLLGERLPLNATVLTVPLARHQGRVIRLDAQAQ
jgi:hypothetical protein